MNSFAAEHRCLRLPGSQDPSLGQQAIDMYVNRDDWDKVHELAAQQVRAGVVLLGNAAGGGCSGD